MYGLDYGKWSLGAWNNLYDFFFCHGQKDFDLFKSRFKGKATIMGYPRYDEYFNLGYDKKKQKLYTQIDLDDKKKSILILTTVSAYFSTIQLYWSEIIDLTKQYNVIIRPHPLEINPNSDRYRQKTLELIADERLRISSSPHEELHKLHTIADFVICDYGGSIFSSLYLKKDVILLNNDGAVKDNNIIDSTSLEIRNFLPSFDKSTISGLQSFLNSESILNKYRDLQIKAREYYFGPLIDNCTQLTSNKLIRILKEEDI